MLTWLAIFLVSATAQTFPNVWAQVKPRTAAFESALAGAVQSTHAGDKLSRVQQDAIAQYRASMANRPLDEAFKAELVKIFTESLLKASPDLIRPKLRGENIQRVRALLKPLVPFEGHDPAKFHAFMVDDLAHREAEVRMEIRLQRMDGHAPSAGYSTAEHATAERVLRVVWGAAKLVNETPALRPAWLAFIDSAFTPELARELLNSPPPYLSWAAELQEVRPLLTRCARAL